MREFERLGFCTLLPEGAVELPFLRTLNSKTYAPPYGYDGTSVLKSMCFSASSQMHFGGDLSDIDLLPVETDNGWEVCNAPYNLQVDKHSLSYTHNMDGVTYQCDLISIDGNPVPAVAGDPAVVPNSIGHNIDFDEVFGSSIISVIAMPYGVTTQQTINNAADLHTLTWKITQNSSAPVASESMAIAYDAGNREAEVIITRSTMTQNPDGTYSYTFSEQATGNIYNIDPNTRVKTAVSGAVYPIIVRS